MKPIAISVCCCVAAAAEIAAQQTPSICMDPPPQSHNATLNAVVERALASLAAPSLSWQESSSRGTARRIPIRKSLDLRSSESSRRTIPWTTFVV